MEGFCKLKGLFHHNELLSFFYKDVFTSEWVNFWMSSKGMRQSLVIIQHAKSLKISILQNF